MNKGRDFNSAQTVYLARKRCPCEFPEIEPCVKHCTCRESHMSRGCSRCASYGSYDQQLAMARSIAARLDQARTLELQVGELQKKLKDYGMHYESCGYSRSSVDGRCDCGLLPLFVEKQEDPSLKKIDADLKAIRDMSTEKRIEEPQKVERITGECPTCKTLGYPCCYHNHPKT